MVDVGKKESRTSLELALWWMGREIDPGAESGMWHARRPCHVTVTKPSAVTSTQLIGAPELLEPVLAVCCCS